MKGLWKRSRVRSIVRSLSLAATALLLSSCSEPDDGRVPVFPVRGEVVYCGKPAAGALVIFHPQDGSDPKAIRPNGRVQEDGSFELTTYLSGDGAPAGEYAVTVFWPEPPTSPLDDPDTGPDRLKGRYSDPKKSELRVQIDESENVLEPFQLK